MLYFYLFGSHVYPFPHKLLGAEKLAHVLSAWVGVRFPIRRGRLHTADSSLPPLDSVRACRDVPEGDAGRLRRFCGLANRCGEVAARVRGLPRPGSSWTADTGCERFDAHVR